MWCTQILTLSGSSSICVVNRPLAVTQLWAGMRTKTTWSPGPEIKVLGVALTDDDSWVVSAIGPAYGICPECGQRTRNRHGWSDRSLQDLPVQGRAVTVKLRLSRWLCAERKCKRQTFTDRLATIATPYARRTRRVAEIVGLLGHSASHRLRQAQHCKMADCSEPSRQT